LLAVSAEEQAQGLMYQKWPPPVMTFIYKHASNNKFWMKNTPSPLDILFCYQGRIKQIHHGEPFSTAIIGDNSLSDLVIELPHGTVDKYGFKVGHKVGLIFPN
jgi:uncharacterized membrane protein (UPF0127 family)